jgi:hypothetical protein
MLVAVNPVTEIAAPVSATNVARSSRIPSTRSVVLVAVGPAAGITVITAASAAGLKRAGRTAVTSGSWDSCWLTDSAADCAEDDAGMATTTVSSALNPKPKPGIEQVVGLALGRIGGRHAVIRQGEAEIQCRQGNHTQRDDRRDQDDDGTAADHPGPPTADGGPGNDLLGTDTSAGDSEHGCKSRSYLAGFNGIVWQGQVPMTRVSLAVSTTSAVMAESSLMLCRSRRVTCLLSQVTGLLGSQLPAGGNLDYAKERDQTTPHDSTIYRPR